MTSLTRGGAGLAIAGSLVAGLALVATPTTAAAADAVCSALTVPVYRTHNPSLNTGLLTRWESEYLKSQQKFGFTEDRGVAGLTASRAQSGMVAVTRMYNTATADFLWAVGDADVARNEQRGFHVSTIGFYAPAAAASCTMPVNRFVKGTDFAMAFSDSERSWLRENGWTDEGVLFHVAPAGAPAPAPAPDPVPAPAGESFSIAVIPDTQTEVVATNDSRFQNRAQWLADNKDDLRLVYALHTGDITNWGWLDQRQFDIAKRGADTLDAAGIPYAFATGNHDTAVVGHDDVAGSRGYGGGAYVNNPECKERYGTDCVSWKLVRNTGKFNENFPLSRFEGVGGAFESGRSDNFYTTFEASGTKWLVLTLELYPRTEVVRWAGGVVASHPNHNVIVNTHGFLDGGSNVDGGNGGYGKSSGTYLWDNVVGRYPNVKLAFSGHIGNAGSRALTGANGNTVLAYLGTYHSTWANPVRIVTINPTTGVVDTVVHSPNVGEDMPGDSTSHTIQIIR